MYVPVSGLGQSVPSTCKLELALGRAESQSKALTRDEVEDPKERRVRILVTDI